MFLKSKYTLCLGLIISVLSGSINTSIAEAKSSYQLIKKTVIGGEGGWDYITIDNDTQKLYLSHSDHVEVIDIKSGKIDGKIKNTIGIHGVAIDNELKKGFTSNGKTSNVSVFNPTTLKVSKEIKVGKNPDTIIYDSFSKNLFVFNAGDSSISVIDPKNEKVIKTIVLDGAPEFAASDDKGKIFVNLEDKNQVLMFDAKTFKILKHWGLENGEEPSGLAIDKKNNLLFSVCSNNLLVVTSIDNGKVVAKLPIGKRVDGVAFDPETNLIFSSNGEGTLTVIHEDSVNKFSVLENVKTKLGARTIALNQKNHHIFLDTSELGETPRPTTKNPRPRPKILSNTFMVLEYANN